jgi:hypothetical protein
LACITLKYILTDTEFPDLKNSYERFGLINKIASNLELNNHEDKNYHPNDVCYKDNKADDISAAPVFQRTLELILFRFNLKTINDVMTDLNILTLQNNFFLVQSKQTNFIHFTPKGT